jgi:hypothetical protein
MGLVSTLDGKFFSEPISNSEWEIIRTSRELLVLTPYHSFFLYWFCDPIDLWVKCSGSSR